MAKLIPFTIWIRENDMIESRYAPPNEDGSMGSIPGHLWVRRECDYINSGNPAKTVEIVYRKRAHGVEFVLAR